MPSIYEVSDNVAACLRVIWKKSVPKRLFQPGFKNKSSLIKLPIRIHIITAYEANVPLCIESSTTYVGIVYIEHFDMTVNTLMSSLTHTHSIS